MQLKASFKKELLYFSRSGKLYVILLVPILIMILFTLFYSYADDIVGVTGMTINPEEMGISTEEFGEYEDFEGTSLEDIYFKYTNQNRKA